MTSLIQTFGRAARNVRGRVILYADTITDSMKLAMGETERRRAIQQAYNLEHGITPETIQRIIHSPIGELYAGDYVDVTGSEDIDAELEGLPESKILSMVEKLRAEMFEAAKNLEFERAGELRDRIARIQSRALKSP